MEEPWMIANTVTSEELYDDPLAGDIEETIDRIIEREKSKLQAEFYAETQRVIERMPHLVSVCYISMAPEVREYAPLKAQSAVTEMITEMREATNQGLAELEGVRARLAGAFQAWYDRSGRKPATGGDSTATPRPSDDVSRTAVPSRGPAARARLRNN
jgi:uncharacterized membrane-anchored protein YjiN (DUF445 family)